MYARSAAVKYGSAKLTTVLPVPAAAKTGIG
jgi:hypothetical protein